MPREAQLPPTIVPRSATQAREPQVVFAPGAPGGTLAVNPTFADHFARVGLKNAASFLDLPGEIVSGHADRHVTRVEIPGAPHAFYLKRQHVVGWRERLRNRLAGFGWVSRCEREAALLQQLEAAGLPAPRWAAFGTLAGRAFLLVEEVPDAIDLRRVLSDAALSLMQRRTLTTQLGEAIASVHTAGFSTPDLSAKHVLVNPETLAVTFLDWQSATRQPPRAAAYADALGALHASLTGVLASPEEWMWVLVAYHRASAVPPKFAAEVFRASARHATRRSVRDQLQSATTNPQRLMWLAGEAVCAVPEVAAVWPRPAIAPPFYGFGPDGTSQVKFAGRDTILLRGRTSAPLGRLRAWLRATPWRSPGVTAGRVLFHLERYGVPAVRLLAFGQRFVSGTTAEWFALHEAPAGGSLRKWRRTASAAERRAMFDSAVECLQKLHESGCVLLDAREAFAVSARRVLIADPRAVQIVRRVSDALRRRDLGDVARLLEVE